jgi:putative aldouronate transport system permease protein
MLGGPPTAWMTKPEYFKMIYVLSGVWQNAGWGTIVYLASLTSISPELHEAAVVDGANKFQRIWHIDIPGIVPVMITLLILDSGKMMSLGFEKVFLLQNQLNLPSAEIVSTYVYRQGLQEGQYSFSTAINLFESVVNMILLFTVNQISKKVSQTYLI